MVGIERRIKAARASPASEKTIVADGSVGSEVQAGKGLDRVRVAHFVQRYPPALGGSEAYFARLSRYLATRGDRVTVYLRKPDADTPAAFRYERHGDLGMFYWVEGSTGYALVGSLSRDELLKLAEAIYKQVQS